MVWPIIQEDASEETRRFLVASSYGGIVRESMKGRGGASLLLIIVLDNQSLQRSA